MSVNNISKLSPTQTVSNIRHQHRCSLIYVKCCNILSKYYKATKVQNTSPNQGKHNKWKRAVLIQSIVRNLGNAPPESPHCCPRTRQQNGHTGHNGYNGQNGHLYKSPRPERSSTLSTTHPNETSPLLPGYK